MLVPTVNINADRGVTYYNFTSDQFTGFHAIVIPGTLRDSMYTSRLLNTKHGCNRVRLWPIRPG